MTEFLLGPQHLVLALQLPGIPVPRGRRIYGGGLRKHFDHQLEGEARNGERMEAAVLSHDGLGLGACAALWLRVSLWLICASGEGGQLVRWTAIDLEDAAAGE